MKKSKHIIGILLFLWITIVPALPLVANAVVTAGNSGVTFQNPLQIGSIQCLIAAILQIVAELGAIVAVFFIIYSGYLFVTAQGDSAQISKARATFLYTIIGTAILLGAWGLANIIAGTIGHVTNQNIAFTGCNS